MDAATDREQQVELVVLTGLQAAGKSSFRRAHLADHAVVSKDLMPNNRNKERRQRQLIEQALRAGRSVVVDNTNATAIERRALVALGRAHDARVVAYRFETTLHDAIARNAARAGRARVPVRGVLATAKRLTAITADEGFDEVWSVQIDPGGGFSVERAIVAPVTSDLDPRMTSLLAAGHLGILATIKRDGRPQLSNISYAYDDDTRTVRISVTDGRAKTANLRRDPRASLHVMTPDGWAWVVAEGTAELSPVAADRNDATVDELVELFRAVQGEHPDWDDYRRAMVEDRRLVIRIPVERVYGQPPQG